MADPPRDPAAPGAPAADPEDPPARDRITPSIWTRFGLLARWGELITPNQLSEAESIQARERRAGAVRPLAEVLVSRGILTRAQCEAVRAAQEVPHVPDNELAFCRIAEENGFLTREQSAAALETQADLIREKRIAPSVGQILVEQGVLREWMVKAVLKACRKKGFGLLSQIETSLRAAGAPLGAAEATVPPFLAGRQGKLILGAAGILVLFLLSRLFAGGGGPAGYPAHCTRPSCNRDFRTERTEATGIPCPYCAEKSGVSIYRCKDCGRTYPILDFSQTRTCPACGARNVERAP